jgi:hypothetical protein
MCPQRPRQIANVHADESLSAWERSAANGVTSLTTSHAVARPGTHVLRVWALAPVLVLQKIIVRTARPRPSDFDPPESAWGARPSRSP